MKSLVMLAGLPGCGKSTYREDEDNVLSTDDYIEWYAQLHGKTYSDVFSSAIKQATARLHMMMKEFIVFDTETIVWDQTNITKSTRMNKLKQFNDAGGKDYEKHIVYFEPDLELAVRINKERQADGRSVPEDILFNMFINFETPTVAEGFDSVSRNFSYLSVPA